MAGSAVFQRHEIAFKDWIKLCDLYKVNWPHNALTFYTLKTYIKWATENPELEIKIYSSNENWRTDGTFILEEHNGPRCNVIFNTLHPKDCQHSMLKALKELPVERDFTFAAFVEKVRNIVEIYLHDLGLKFQKNCCSTLLYYLPLKKSLALDARLNPGYELRHLSEEHVQQIDCLWPHKYPGSDKFISNVIHHNLTLGAFEIKTGKLCGWVMQEQVGTIGLLQVLDSYKRQGLGEQLVRHMAKLMANADMDALATVMCTNRSSRQLFHKLGFIIIDRVYWYDKVTHKAN